MGFPSKLRISCRIVGTHCRSWLQCARDVTSEGRIVTHTESNERSIAGTSPSTVLRSRAFAKVHPGSRAEVNS
jgi:hypothetical protein